MNDGTQLKTTRRRRSLQKKSSMEEARSSESPVALMKESETASNADQEGVTTRRRVRRRRTESSIQVDLNSKLNKTNIEMGADQHDVSTMSRCDERKGERRQRMKILRRQTIGNIVTTQSQDKPPLLPQTDILTQEQNTIRRVRRRRRPRSAYSDVTIGTKSTDENNSNIRQQTHCDAIQAWEEQSETGGS